MDRRQNADREEKRKEKERKKRERDEPVYERLAQCVDILST
jgi:hypothetical protein